MSVKNPFDKDWPLEDVKRCVGKGWSGLIERLYKLCEENGVAIFQVKEKFGGLRFYIGEAPDFVHSAIEEAEDESYMICENCGEPSSPRDGSLIKTLCNKCANAPSNKHKEID